MLNPQNDSMIRTNDLPAKKRVSSTKPVIIALSDFEDAKKSDAKERLQKLENLAEKMLFQLRSCFAGCLFFVAAYFLIWYFSQCWALPFQESPCKQPRDLPLFKTNQSTLAEAVDEFTLLLQAQIAKLRDTPILFNVAQRQALSDVTKNDIAHLFSQYSADLVAFGALKREDARLLGLERAMSDGYLLVAFVLFVSMMCMGTFAGEIRNINHEAVNEEMSSAEVNENLQNARLKQLKRRIPILYRATFTCVAIGVTLYSMLFAGHYYGGTCPNFMYKECHTDTPPGSNDTERCPFVNYGTFSNNLVMILNRQIGKLDSFMASPLEVRQTVWLYESDVIDAAIEAHQDLKQYNVDRRTMPRKIGKNADDCSVVNEKYKLKHSCTFTDYPSYSTKLETILDRHISKLNSFMSSPLEVRQMVWLYESDVLDAGILNHLDLKRYNVDRRTMPRKIGNVLPDTLCFICSLAFLFFCITVNFTWAAQEGSIWQIFKCVRIFTAVSRD
ncbi:hypothetical protein DdX_21217 [Ditylenchus destructor]|uniref:Uncharacterized protein n=1 Tax=Ditylenchus destructor TaxID=166010 RepID=A0AAD4MG42_9BILA|nr:hypothetical protein DdX_21217 [Ditylenchus destructor]